MSKGQKKLVVTNVSVSAKDDLVAPKEFSETVDEILKEGEITDKNFLVCSKIATEFKQKYPQKRRAIAYRMAGIWLAAASERKSTVLMEEIGREFGLLELPDNQVAEGVDKAWGRITDLVKKRNL